MSTCSILRAVLSASALVIFLQINTVAQLVTDQTRPRTLASSATEMAGDSEVAVGSPEAKSEAKKAYKAGVEYGNAGLYTQAADLFKRAIRLRPDYADAYRSLGHAYYDLKDWDNAIPSFERALELNPKDKDAHQWLELSRSMKENAPKSSMSSKSEPAKPSATKVSASETPLTKIYRVGRGDVLDVSLNGANATAVTVNDSGKLEHPSFSESLPVVGLTIEEITSALKQRTNANVAIEVHEYVSHVIMVSGLVKEPGAKILRREGIPLSVVVADAQPLPEAERAVIVRNETTETFSVDLTQPTETNLLVRPGDVITLQTNPTQFFYVSGEVKAPGEKVFRRGLTLTQAIMTAGGLNGKAKEARLGRTDAKGFLILTRYELKEIDLGKVQDPLIQPGDRITIVN